MSNGHGLSPVSASWEDSQNVSPSISSLVTANSQPQQAPSPRDRQERSAFSSSSTSPRIQQSESGLERQEEESLAEVATSQDESVSPISDSSRRQTPHQRRQRPSGTWFRASSIAEEEENGLDELAAPTPVLPHPPSAQPTPFPSRMSTQRPSERSSGRSSRLYHASSQDHSSLSEVSARRIAELRHQRPHHEDGWYSPHFLEESGYQPEDDEAVREDSEQGEKHQMVERRSSQWLTQLYVVSHLIFFAILGTLARIGTDWLVFYRGAPVVFPSIWSNFSGTLFMGFLIRERQLFRAGYGLEAKRKLAILQDEGVTKLAKQPSRDQKTYASSKKTIPLYIGLSVGFCGSYTTFSIFMRDAFLAMSNDLPTPQNHLADVAQSVSIDSTAPRNGGYSALAVLAVLILTVSVSMAALFIGGHIALALDPILRPIPFSATRRFIDPLIVFLGWSTWIGAVIMAIWPPDRPGGPRAPADSTWEIEQWRGEVIMALVFAPAGCLLRFLLAIKLNTLIPRFPIGTFAANVFGTVILGMCYDLQHVPLLAGGALMVGGGHVGCQVLVGVQTGFCGALTTVSTWILELETLRRRHAWVYGIVSVAVGLGSLVVIMGSVRWTMGFSPIVCVTTRTT